MSNRPSINMLYAFILVAVCFIFAQNVFNSYMDFKTPKTPEFYKNNSYKTCIETVSRTQMTVISKEQIETCSNSVEVLYAKKP